jgi:predicted site-specific integrase-resolvase
VSSAVRHLSPAALADRLDVSTETLRDWRRYGRGPAYIRSEGAADKGTIRYRLADVEEWEESRIVRPRG